MNEIKYPPNTGLDISEFYNLVKGMKYDCGTMSSDIPICSPKKQRFIQHYGEEKKCMIKSSEMMKGCWSAVQLMDSLLQK